MKTYLRHQNGMLQDGSLFVPPSESNSDYKRIIAEVTSNKAKLVAAPEFMTATDKRRQAFTQQCDPLMNTIKAYELEIEFGSTDPKIEEKLLAAKEAWWIARTKIREEIV